MSNNKEAFGNKNITTKNVAENLQLLLFKNKITLAKLAKELSLPEMTIRRLLSGETLDPRLSTLEIISQYFNISLDELVYQSQPKEESNQFENIINKP